MSDHDDFDSWLDELKQIEPAAGITDPLLWLRFFDSDMTPAEALKEAETEDHEDDVAPNGPS